MESFVAIDFETANEQRYSACAVGLVRYDQEGEIADRFYSLLRPHPEVDYFSPINTAVHGITAAQVDDAPQWSAVAQTITKFIGDKPIVAHNMAFDGYVLSDLNKLYQLNSITNRRFCTLRLARKILADKIERKRLIDVYDYYFSGESFTHHNAITDAEACGRIFARMQQDYSFLEIEQLCPIPRARGNRRAFSDTANKTTATELISTYGRNETALLGERVVFTGTLQRGKRAAIQKLVEAVGGVADKSLMKNTTMLVVGIPNPRALTSGSSASQKLSKARQIRQAGSSIEIMSEEEFFNRLTDEMCAE